VEIVTRQFDREQPMQVNATRAVQLALWAAQYDIGRPALVEVQRVLNSDAGHLDLTPIAVREVPPFLRMVHALDSLSMRFAAEEGIHIDIAALPRLRRLYIAGGEARSIVVSGADTQERSRKFETFELTGGVQLHELKLRNCALDTVRVRDVPQLRVLEVSGCRLRHLEVEAAPRLKHLDAPMNRLNHDGLALDYMERLATVNLERNRLSRIPSALGNAPALRELYLQANQISNPGPQDLPDGLVSLDLSNNRLTIAPFGLTCAATLRDLKLDLNRIASVTEEMGLFRRLETLDLSHNRIQMMPSSICQCTLLQRLNLASNRLIWLPPEICELPALDTLQLGHNALLMLPHEMFRLTRLTSLQAQCNALTALPARLDEVPLGRLNLRGNPLLSVPEPLLRERTQAGRPSFEGLVVLDLGQTRLAEVARGLGHRRWLVQLSLSGNEQLCSLPEDFMRLVQLERLDLTGCGFRQVPSCLMRVAPRSDVLMRWNPLDQRARMRIQRQNDERAHESWATTRGLGARALIPEEVRAWRELSGAEVTPKSEAFWNALLPFDGAAAFAGVLAGLRGGDEFLRSSPAAQTRLVFAVRRMLDDIEENPGLCTYIFDEADLTAAQLMDRYRHSFDWLALATRLHALAREAPAQSMVAASLMWGSFWRESVAQIARYETREGRVDSEIMLDLTYRIRLAADPGGFPFDRDTGLDALAVPLADTRVAVARSVIQQTEQTSLIDYMTRSPPWRRYLTRAFSGEYLALIAHFDEQLDAWPVDASAGPAAWADARDVAIMRREEAVHDWLRRKTIALLTDNPLIEPPP
jgi:Leucine-rich repeat (LRR) protein